MAELILIQIKYFRRIIILMVTLDKGNNNPDENPEQLTELGKAVIASKI